MRVLVLLALVFLPVLAAADDANVVRTEAQINVEWGDLLEEIDAAFSPADLEDRTTTTMALRYGWSRPDPATVQALARREFAGCSCEWDVKDRCDRGWEDGSTLKEEPKSPPKSEPKANTLEVVQDGEPYTVNAGEPYAEVRFPFKVINHTGRVISILSIEVILVNAEGEQVGATRDMFFDIPAWTTLRKYVAIDTDEVPAETKGFEYQWQAR